MSIYSEKVMEHFRNPHNYGNMPDPDGVGEVGNIVCGDVMYLYIKVGENKKGIEIIKDVMFETYGCVAAIATSSIITDLAKGKTIDEAIKIEKDSIVDSLDTLPPIKIHCSFLATDALKEAVYDYLTKNKKKIPKELLEAHNRIKQEKGKVEERYKDWVDMEKELI